MAFKTEVKLELTLELMGDQSNMKDGDIWRYLTIHNRARVTDSKIVSNQMVAITPKIDIKRRALNQRVKVLRGLLPGDYHVKSYTWDDTFELYYKDNNGQKTSITIRFDGKTLKWGDKKNGGWVGVDIADPNPNAKIEKWWAEAQKKLEKPKVEEVSF